MRTRFEQDDSNAESVGELRCSLLDFIGNYRNNLGAGLHRPVHRLAPRFHLRRRRKSLRDLIFASRDR